MDAIAKNRRKAAIRRKKLEAELAEGERTIRALLDASPAAEFLVGADGKILVHNQAFERFFGGGGKPLAGRNIQDLLTPEEIQVNRDKALEVISTGKPVFFEDSHRGLRLEKKFTPILDEGGRVAKIACYARDVSEKKRAAEALKDNELRYRLLAENVSDFIWTADRNLRLTYISPGVTRLLGYTPEEMMAMKLEDLLMPGSLALVWKAYKQEKAKEEGGAKGQPQPQVLVLEHRRKDGSSLWAETRSRPVFDSEGKVVSVVGITQDISDRKKAEETARRWAEENAVMAEISRIISSSLNIEEVYERFAQEVGKLIEFENITIAMINPENRSMAITHVSGNPVPGREAGTVITLDGTLVGEIYKTRSSFLISEENLEETVRKFPKIRPALEGGRRSMILVPLISEDRVFGSLNILSSRPAAYTRADVEMAERVATQIAGAVANAQLFGECRRMEQEVRESEAKFREVFQNANDLIFLHPIIDFQTPGLFLEVNNMACRKLGYTREELLGLSPRDITFEFERLVSSIGQDVFTRAKDLGEYPHFTFEATLVAKDGKLLPVEMTFQAFSLKNQEVALAIARDITERKKAEREMIDHQARLEETVRDRTARIQELEGQRTEIEKMAATGVLAARIAHEINNPLAGIKGSFMLLEDAIPRDHPYHHYIKRIHREINRIARIVRQMFELYRAPEDDPEEWGFEQMVQDIVALLKDEAREREVSFQIPVLPVEVRIPAGPMRQVLFNVIKNAVEASPVEGRVRVSVQGGEREISIQVVDEGPGISEKNRPHVFKPFFSTKKGRQKGLGLGLFISKEIVESLGGSIRLQNLRGKGLLCQIDLPGRKQKKENRDV